MKEAVKYFGKWQERSVVSEKLEGPTGQGRVEFPNGDRFEGYFYLHFANIQGPCYVAKGKYTFADGKYIENAWINTSEDLTKFGLKGVYEVHNADGSLASITSFWLNERHGIEVLTTPEAEAVEWYSGKEQKHYEIDRYSLNAINEACRELVVELATGETITMVGGRYILNKYDNQVYENYLSGIIAYTNGEVFTSVNYNIRNLQPYDGVGTRSLLNGKIRDEYYKGYELTDIKDEHWDSARAEVRNIPDPIHPENFMEARVWSNHIEYNDRYHMIYDGDVVDGMPHGQGMLSNMRSQAFINGTLSHTWFFTYKGTFEHGRCHGSIVFTDHEKNTTCECEWKNGRSVGMAPVVLRYEWKCYFEGETEIRTGTVEMGTGMKLPLERFGYVYLLERSASQIAFNVCEPLRPGNSISLENELTYDLRYYLNLYWDKE